MRSEFHLVGAGPKNKLKIRILSQPSILVFYLIRHASVILFVGLHL